ncbi:MAG: hypothetical protein LBT27_05110, partial [Prevotellaceae bacterium]|nr:hypothetical protein [Prevotellaceae bacterium]
MKKIISIISLILIFFTFNEKLYAQTSTQGKDFWVSFGKNWTQTANEVNLQVRIVASQDALVTFTYKQTGIIYSLPVILAGEVRTITLSSATPHQKS